MLAGFAGNSGACEHDSLKTCHSRQGIQPNLEASKCDGLELKSIQTMAKPLPAMSGANGSSRKEAVSLWYVLVQSWVAA